MSKLNASTLKGELWKTLQELRGNKIDAASGAAIASQAREILRTVRTQLIIAEKAQAKLPGDLRSFALQTEKGAK